MHFRFGYYWIKWPQLLGSVGRPDGVRQHASAYFFKEPCRDLAVVRRAAGLRSNVLANPDKAVEVIADDAASRIKLEVLRHARREGDRISSIILLGSDWRDDNT